MLAPDGSSGLPHTAPPPVHCLALLALVLTSHPAVTVVSPAQIRSDQVRSGLVRSGQVRSGQVRSGQVSNQFT